MHFVIDKPRLQDIIAIVREKPRKRGDSTSEHFLRIEAIGESVTVRSRDAAATIPATVYEQGVLFLRVSHFQRMLRAIRSSVDGLRYITIQVSNEGMFFSDVWFPSEIGDMLLYPNPATAPEHHPDYPPNKRSLGRGGSRKRKQQTGWFDFALEEELESLPLFRSTQEPEEIPEDSSTDFGEWNGANEIEERSMSEMGTNNTNGTSIEDLSECFLNQLCQQFGADIDPTLVGVHIAHTDCVWLALTRQNSRGQLETSFCEIGYVGKPWLHIDDWEPLFEITDDAETHAELFIEYVIPRMLTDEFSILNAEAANRIKLERDLKYRRDGYPGRPWHGRPLCAEDFMQACRKAIESCWDEGCDVRSFSDKILDSSGIPLNVMSEEMTFLDLSLSNRTKLQIARDAIPLADDRGIIEVDQDWVYPRYHILDEYPDNLLDQAVLEAINKGAKDIDDVLRFVTSMLGFEVSRKEDNRSIMAAYSRLRSSGRIGFEQGSLRDLAVS